MPVEASPTPSRSPSPDVFYDSDGNMYVPDSEPEREAERENEQALPPPAPRSLIRQNSDLMYVSLDEENNWHQSPSKASNSRKTQRALARASQETLILEPMQTSSAEVSQLLTINSQPSTQSSLAESTYCNPPSSPLSSLSQRLADIQDIFAEASTPNGPKNDHVHPASTPRRRRGPAKHVETPIDELDESVHSTSPRRRPAVALASSPFRSPLQRPGPTNDMANPTREPLNVSRPGTSNSRNAVVDIVSHPSPATTPVRRCEESRKEHRSAPNYSEEGLNIEQQPVASTSSTPREKVPTRGTLVSNRRNYVAKQPDPELARVAKQFYEELVAGVFKSGISDKTVLVWSNRLTRTAGRATFRRESNGKEVSQIELAVKILDREERIRNTLAHELCHLAVWTIDDLHDPRHGPEWQAWAERVMAVYPDIQITRLHSYDPEYPFKWKCIVCGAGYGRFTRSIDPKENACSKCLGDLAPVHDQPISISSNHRSSTTSATPALRNRQHEPDNEQSDAVPLKPDPPVIDLTHEDFDVDDVTTGLTAINLN